MPREAGIQYAAAFEGDNNCHGVLGSSAFADDDSRGWGSSSNGTETPIQRFSVRQDDLSVASRLPVLYHYRPHQERFRSGPLRDLPPTSDGSLMTVGFVVVLRNVAQSAAAWLA